MFKFIRSLFAKRKVVYDIPPEIYFKEFVSVFHGIQFKTIYGKSMRLYKGVDYSLCKIGDVVLTSDGIDALGEFYQVIPSKAIRITKEEYEANK